MSEIAWEKPQQAAEQPPAGQRAERMKFLIGGILILAAIGYLVISSTTSSARYFITVDDLVTNPDYAGKTVRISGAVIGDTIIYDKENLIIDFTVANIADDTGDLATALYKAVSDPEATRLSVHIENEVMPDLLRHEAQAILSGTLGEDGVFYATELLLKCPSRYGEKAPDQAEGEA